MTDLPPHLRARYESGRVDDETEDLDEEEDGSGGRAAKSRAVRLTSSSTVREGVRDDRR